VKKILFILLIIISGKNLFADDSYPYSYLQQDYQPGGEITVSYKSIESEQPFSFFVMPANAGCQGKVKMSYC